MKNSITIIFLIALFSINTSKASNWLTSMEEAQKMALATDKLILVDFWAIWCGPCKKMDSETWSKDEVKQLMNAYVPVKIDIDKETILANQYGVQGIPYIFIMDGNGKVLYKQMSYKSKTEMIKLLNKYALNTQFLRNDLINFFKDENFTTSFRLASKLQDYSLYVQDKDVKRDLLKLSNEYFRMSSSFLKKSDMKNKEVYQQKIDLFEIQEYLILENSKKALRKLAKYDEASIADLNQSFYNFLYYLGYNMNGDESSANDFKTKLSDFEIKKGELFLTPVVVAE